MHNPRKLFCNPSVGVRFNIFILMTNCWGCFVSMVVVVRGRTLLMPLLVPLHYQTTRRHSFIDGDEVAGSIHSHDVIVFPPFQSFANFHLSLVGGNWENPERAPFTLKQWTPHLHFPWALFKAQTHHRRV